MSKCSAAGAYPARAAVKQPQTGLLAKRQSLAVVSQFDARWQCGVRGFMLQFVPHMREQRTLCADALGNFDGLMPAQSA